MFRQTTWRIIFGLGCLLVAGGGRAAELPGGKPAGSDWATLDAAINRRLLSECGPYKTVAKARATLEKAAQAVTDVRQALGSGHLSPDGPRRLKLAPTVAFSDALPQATRMDWQLMR
jgi:hypothetical protein